MPAFQERWRKIIKDSKISQLVLKYDLYYFEIIIDNFVSRLKTDLTYFFLFNGYSSLAKGKAGEISGNITDSYLKQITTNIKNYSELASDSKFSQDSLVRLRTVDAVRQLIDASEKPGVVSRYPWIGQAIRQAARRTFLEGCRISKEAGGKAVNENLKAEIASLILNPGEKPGLSPKFKQFLAMILFNFLMVTLES